MTWIITGVLALLVVRIIYLEIVCGRKSKAFLTKIDQDTAEITRNATSAYRAKFGRDPTAPFPIVNPDEKKT